MAEMRLEQYILLAVVLFAAVQLSSLLHLPPPPRKTQLPEAVVGADISNGLGWRIFSCLSGSSSRHNIIFSPVSIATSLAILYYGALGNLSSAVKIRCGISSLLQPPNSSYWCSDQLAVNKSMYEPLCSTDCPPGIYFRELLSALDTYNTTDATIDIANGIWHHGHFHSLFKLNVKNYFKPDLMMFMPKKPASAASRINKWVTNVTRGKVPSIINDDTIQESDKVFIFNVLYFQAFWKISFTPHNATKSFKTCLACDGNIAPEASFEEVEYMEKMENVLYSKMSTLTAIRLPYVNKELSMTIILPNLCSMKAVEDQLINGDLLRDINNHLVPRKTHIMLPKFDLEQKLPVNSILSKLGLQSLYSEGFSTILKNTRNLQLSKVSHQSVLEVNEKGMIVAC